MKFWADHRKFKSKILTNFGKTSSIKCIYSCLTLEAELFLKNIGVGKKEAMFLQDDGQHCSKRNEPAARNASACMLILSKWEHLKAIVCVILKWPRIAINSLNGFLLAAQAYLTFLPCKELFRRTEHIGHMDWRLRLINPQIVVYHWKTKTKVQIQL